MIVSLTVLTPPPEISARILQGRGLVGGVVLVIAVLTIGRDLLEESLVLISAERSAQFLLNQSALPSGASILVMVYTPLILSVKLVVSEHPSEGWEVPCHASPLCSELPDTPLRSKSISGADAPPKSATSETRRRLCPSASRGILASLSTILAVSSRTALKSSPA